jgi:hypothetical protein
MGQNLAAKKLHQVLFIFLKFSTTGIEVFYKLGRIRPGTKFNHKFQIQNKRQIHAANSFEI